MNRLCYRVIFNKTLGRLVVVSEKTTSQGKSDSPAMSGSTPAISKKGFGLTSMAFAMLSCLGLISQTAAAQNPIEAAGVIIADKAASKTLQPMITDSAAGITTINIQTPNDKGLSNNHYSRFDVGTQGAILNNARKATSTQLAGYVSGNPYLAKGEATTILNQVNSNQPSYINGFIEVAGKKADVIVANPSGLQLNNTGFINAGNVHLASAKAQVVDGRVKSLEVGAGEVAVHGKVNLQNTDYAAIISKTAQINAEIYAGEELDVVLGDNTVDISETKSQITQSQRGQASKGVALDVSALGGMYAGKIRLVGTQDGMGVHQAGSVVATGTGGLQIQSNGDIVNTGSLLAKQAVDVSALTNIQNKGTILSEQAGVSLSSDNLDNQGLIHTSQTAKISAKTHIGNSENGSITAGVLNISANTAENQGKIMQTGLGALSLTTNTLENTKGAIIGKALYQAPATTNTPTSSSQAQSGVATGSDNGANTQDTQILSADGYIKVASKLTNDGAAAYIGGMSNHTVTANSTKNTGKSSIGVDKLNTNTLINQDSRIAVDEAKWTLSSFDNTQGELSTKGMINISSNSTINNTLGKLLSQDEIILAAKDTVDNTKGVILAKDKVTVTTNNLNNTQGYLEGAQVTVSANDSITGDKGQVVSKSTLTLKANDITLGTGTLNSDQDLGINATKFTSDGHVYSGGLLSLNAEQASLGSNAYFAAKDSVLIDTGVVDSKGTILAGADKNGVVGGASSLMVAAKQKAGLHGINIASKDIQVQSESISLSDSQTNANHIALNAAQGVSTQNATVVAGKSLQIATQDTLDNSGGVLSTDSFDLQANKLINQKGVIQVVSQDDLALTLDGGIDNTGGVIHTNAQSLALTSNLINNQQGKIIHAGEQGFEVTAGAVNNTDGVVLSDSDAQLSVAQINNTRGVIRSASMNASGEALGNTDGAIIGLQDGGVSLSFDQYLKNTGANAAILSQGAIALQTNQMLNDGQVSGQSILVDAQALDNTGRMVSNTTSDITARAIDNKGVIVSGSDVFISSEVLNQAQGAGIYAGVSTNPDEDVSPANLDITSNVVHNQGDLFTGGDLTVQSNHLSMQGGKAQALGSIKYDIQKTLNHNKGTTVAGGVLNIATQTLTNNQGVLQAASAIIYADDLRNGGAILVDDKLDITEESDFTHEKSDVIQAARLYINTQGKLVNNGTLAASQSLSADAASVTNQGDMVGAEKLSIATKTLTNRGIIFGDKSDITSSLLDNQGGSVLGGDRLEVRARSAIQNKGIISSNHTNLATQSLENGADSRIVGADNLSVWMDGKLNNRGIITGGTVGINAPSSITNAKDAVLHADNQLNLANQGDFLNQGVIAAADIQLDNAGAFTNTATGQVQASSRIALSAANDFVNDGSFYAKTTLVASKASVSNNKEGVIVGVDATGVSAARQLKNTGFIGGGDVEIEGDSVLNAGVDSHIQATKTLRAIAHQGLKNEGLLESASDSTINAVDLVTNAQGATIRSGGYLALNSYQSAFDNNGVVLADSAVIRAHGSITNAQDAEILTSNDMSLFTNQHLDNQGVIKGGDVTMQAVSGVTNHETGRVLGAKSVSIEAVSGDINNHNMIAGNSVSLDSANNIINHNSAQILAASNLSLQADSKLINHAKIAGGSVNIHTLDALQNAEGATIHGDEKLQAWVVGNLNNSGVIQAKDVDLSVQGSAYNDKSATIRGANTLNTTIRGNLTNQGLIDGGDVVLKSQQDINNSAGGRIYGTNLKIGAQSVRNTPAKINETDAHNTAPVIAARNDLHIGAQTILNEANSDRANKFNTGFESQALIVANGNITLGGMLNHDNEVITKAAVIKNTGATIESGGDMTIAAESFTNENADFESEIHQVGEPTRVNEYHLKDDRGNIAASFTEDGKSVYILRHGWYAHGENWEKTLVTPSGNYQKYTQERYLKTDYEAKTTQSDPSLIRAGGKMNLQADQGVNDKSFMFAGGAIAAGDNLTDASEFGLENRGAVGESYHVRSENEVYNWHTAPRRRPDNRFSKRPYTYQSGNLANYSANNRVDGAMISLPLLPTSIETVVLPKTAAAGELIAVTGQDKPIDLLPVSIELPNGIVKQPLEVVVDRQNLDSEDYNVVLDTLEGYQGLLSKNAQKSLTNLLSAQENGGNIDSAVVKQLALELKQVIDTTKVDVATSAEISVSIPRTAMHIIDADSPNAPLVQTDPAFTNYRQWLSSDYMLKALQSDPNRIAKRLYDGYNELKLVLDQYQLLSGFNPATDYQTQESVYKTLMDNGIAFAKQFHIAPGVALTSEQMAQITTSMVLLVEQTVELPVTAEDGTVSMKRTPVLVPKVYLKSSVAASGKLRGNGAYTTLSGADIDLNNLQSLTNTGELVAKNLLSVQAEDITNKGLLKADFVKLHADNDVVNHNQIFADKAAMLSAGRDVANESLTNTTKQQSGSQMLAERNITKVAQVTVADGLKQKLGDALYTTPTLSVQAGRYVYLPGSSMANMGGGTFVSGEQGVHLDALDAQSSLHAIGDENNYYKRDSQKIVGSSVIGRGDVVIQATGDAAKITGASATIASGQGVTVLSGRGGVELTAEHDVTGSSVSNTYAERKYYGTKHHVSKSASHNSQTVAGVVAGSDVYIDSAKGDVLLEGVHVRASDLANITADEGVVSIRSEVNEKGHQSLHTTSNFYKNTGSGAGSTTQTLHETGVQANNINIQAKSTQIDGALIQADKSGGVTIGDAVLAVDSNGKLILDENKRPVVLYGDSQDISFGTVALESESWDESSKSYKGPVKEVMKVAGALRGWFDNGKTVTVSRHSRTDTQRTQEAESTVRGGYVTTGAETVTAEGTNFDTYGTGQAVVLGQTTVLGTADNKTIVTQNNREIVAGGHGPELKRTKLSVGELELKDTKQQVITTQEDKKGVSLNGSQLVLLGGMQEGGALVAQGVDIDVGADGKVLIGADKTLLDGFINNKKVDDTVRTNTTRVGLTLSHVATDAAETVEDYKESMQDLNRARLELRQAQRDVAEGRLDASAIKDYEANVAMAGVNVANARFAMSKAAAEAAKSTKTAGFVATVHASHTMDKQVSTSTDQEFVGSSIKAGDVSLVGSEMTAKGLQGEIGRLNVQGLDKLTLTHGVEKATNRTKGDSKTVHASYASTDTATVGGSVQNSSSYDDITRAVDTVLTVGRLDGSADTTVLDGARIIASGGDYQTGSLTAKTSQNVRDSEGKSSGVSASVTNSGSFAVGVNQSKQSVETKMNNSSSGIVYMNADNHSLKAGETKLIGGMISAVQSNKDGTLSDAPLNFTTGKLEAEDLHGHSIVKSSGVGVNVNLASQASSDASKGGSADLRSLGLSGSRGGSETRVVTKATVGDGAVVTGSMSYNGETGAESLAAFGVNQSYKEAYKVLKDVQTGGLDIKTELDGRMFSSSGRAEMREEHHSVGKNFQKAGEDLGKDISKANRNIVKGALKTADFVGVADYTPEKALKAAEKIEGIAGLLGVPTEDNLGGLYSQLTINAGASDSHYGQVLVVSDPTEGKKMFPNKTFVEIEQMPGYDKLDPSTKQQIAGLYVSEKFTLNDVTAATLTDKHSMNGMLNNTIQGVANGVIQSYNLRYRTNEDGAVIPLEKGVVLTHSVNPTRGGVADFVESAQDKTAIVLGPFGKYLSTGIAQDTGEYLSHIKSIAQQQGKNIDLYTHSQGNLITASGINNQRDLYLGKPKDINDLPEHTINMYMYGSPLNANDDFGILLRNGVRLQEIHASEKDGVTTLLGGNQGVFVYDETLSPEENRARIKQNNHIRWWQRPGYLKGMDMSYHSYNHDGSRAAVPEDKKSGSGGSTTTNQSGQTKGQTKVGDTVILEKEKELDKK